LLASCQVAHICAETRPHLRWETPHLRRASSAATYSFQAIATRLGVTRLGVIVLKEQGDTLFDALNCRAGGY
jgi:hypothetical protein